MSALPATHRGIRVGYLRTMRPVLENWLAVTEQLADEWIPQFDDAPWWYNERASMSVFAGAVWLGGGWAFEEFAASKKEKQGRGRIRETKGRCDLNFSVNGHEYIAEAKQCWPKIDRQGNAERVVLSSLGAALRDCASIPDWGLPVLGITFVVPRLLASHVDALDTHVERFVQWLGAIPEATVAWTFPRSARVLTSGGAGIRRLFPGAVLVMKRAA